eukprot:SAG31_NODE_4280_length_3383_cov_3.430268_2_plen_155_part_00
MGMLLIFDTLRCRWNGDYAADACWWTYPDANTRSGEWGGVYYTEHCPNRALAIKKSSAVIPGKYFPSAQWMSANTSAADNAFERSFSNMIWPRTIAAAGSFWHFVPKLSKQRLHVALQAVGARLQRDGVFVCPSLDPCCNYTHACGQPYAGKSK